MPHSKSHVYEGIRYSIARVRKRQYRWYVFGALQPGLTGKDSLNLAASEEAAHAAAKAAIDIDPRVRRKKPPFEPQAAAP